MGQILRFSTLKLLRPSPSPKGKGEKGRVQVASFEYRVSLYRISLVMDMKKQEPCFLDSCIQGNKNTYTYRVLSFVLLCKVLWANNLQPQYMQSSRWLLSFVKRLCPANQLFVPRYSGYVLWALRVWNGNSFDN